VRQEVRAEVEGDQRVRELTGWQSVLDG